jgi:hypothetical protein
MDCQGWIVVHMYMVEGWKHVHILLTLEQILFGVTTNNLIKVIVGSIEAFLKLIWFPNLSALVLMVH